MRSLVFAYACEPGKGSEPETGWAWARLLARFGEAWVITRANNRESIEAELASLPDRERLRFVYVDLPPWARVWKRGKRGLRLYYLLWQVAAVRAARQIDRRHRCDVVWHVSLANLWLGSLAPLASPAPFVFGPVGGGVGAPWRLLGDLGPSGAAYELSRSLARTVGRYANPLTHLACSRARVILAQNRETRAWVPRRSRGKTIVFPHVIFAAPPATTQPASRGTRTALFAGRLLAWKGAALAVQAVAEAPGWKLVLYGDGPERARLERLIRRLGVEDRVELAGALPRDELLAAMQRADVFLFPSLHEDASFAVVEALSMGLPVVCVDRGGPPIVSGRAGVAVDPRGDGAAISARLAAALTSPSLPPPAAVATRAREFTLDRREQRVRELLDVFGIASTADGGSRAT
jgi:glycosyltransferase involved in cell wall biosynthesis